MSQIGKPVRIFEVPSFPIEAPSFDPIIPARSPERVETPERETVTVK